MQLTLLKQLRNVLRLGNTHIGPREDELCLSAGSRTVLYKLTIIHAACGTIVLPNGVEEDGAPAFWPTGIELLAPCIRSPELR